MSDIIRTYKIPKNLIGAGREKIRAWAKEKLKGQEPKLSSNELSAIDAGRISEVFLEPKIMGTYLPDGTFIEALDTSVEFGEDLDEVDKRIEKEERLIQWVDEENKRFNKITWSQSSQPIRLLWEHGKRIVELGNEIKMPTHDIIQKLKQRGGADDYTEMKHEYCVHLYNWKPIMNESDQIYFLNWKIIAHIIMFGMSDDKIKDYTLEMITSTSLKELKSAKISLLLLENLNKEMYLKKYTDEEKVLIMTLRRKIKVMDAIDQTLINNIIEILS